MTTLIPSITSAVCFPAGGRLAPSSGGSAAPTADVWIYDWVCSDVKSDHRNNQKKFISIFCLTAALSSSIRCAGALKVTIKLHTDKLILLHLCK